MNSELTVNIQNNFDPQREKTTGGIGLQNLRRRVQHYYGNKATYVATSTNDVYLFQLSCTLL
jgi:sensor histidine kinase YesM